jgi:alpha-N-arabinofuranosidase
MILTEDGGERMLLTPTYHVFEMYKVHQSATLLPLDLHSDDYTFGGNTIPAISATASRNSENEVHISLSNLNPNAECTITCTLHGLQAIQNDGVVSGRILTAETIDAHNTFDEPEVVQPADFNGASLTDDTLTIHMPAKSVVTLALRKADHDQ